MFTLLEICFIVPASIIILVFFVIFVSDLRSRKESRIERAREASFRAEVGAVGRDPIKIKDIYDRLDKSDTCLGRVFNEVVAESGYGPDSFGRLLEDVELQKEADRTGKTQVRPLTASEIKTLRENNYSGELYSADDYQTDLHFWAKGFGQFAPRGRKKKD